MTQGPNFVENAKNSVWKHIKNYIENLFSVVSQLHPLLQAEPVNALNLPSLSQHEGYNMSTVCEVGTSAWVACMVGLHKGKCWHKDGSSGVIYSPAWLLFSTCTAFLTCKSLSSTSIMTCINLEYFLKREFKVT